MEPDSDSDDQSPRKKQATSQSGSDTDDGPAQFRESRGEALEDEGEDVRHFKAGTKITIQSDSKESMMHGSTHAHMI